MKYEICCDEDDWCWKMPSVSNEYRYELGTWDYADWTFGTSAPLLALWSTKPCFSHKYFNPLTKVMWKLENLLRRYQWVFFFKNKRILYWITHKLRDIVFDIAWKLSEYDLDRVECEDQ